MRPIVGLDHVVRLFEGLFRKLTREPPVLVDWVWIDGLPGYVSYERDGALQTTALEIEDGRILAIFITRNPDKLKVAADMAASRHQIQ
ncbi:RNA polymerase sigma factor SigJ [compost metagenome]